MAKPTTKKTAPPAAKTAPAPKPPQTAATPAIPAAAAAAIAAIPDKTPTLPLSKDDRAFYQGLYDALQAALDATNDATAVNTLMDPRDAVKQVLDLNDTYALNQNTAAYNDLVTQIKAVNKSLATLKAQIQAVASHIATAGTIITAIDKLVTIIPTL